MGVTFKVFKKWSPNGKVTLYLGRRDFVDHISSVDPVDGVVLLDSELLRGHTKVWAQLLCSFRYGREEEEVMGLTFQKDLFLASEQVFPPAKRDVSLTKLQERLITKLGSGAYPFTFTISQHAPNSVSIQSGGVDDEKNPLGVEFLVRVFAGDSSEVKPGNRSLVELGIRKVQYAPSKQGKQPVTLVRKDFLLSPGELELEASLDKQLYYHGEQIGINIGVRNYSNKEVKKMKASVQQCVDITMFNTGQYRTTVASVETEEGCPIGPGSALQKVVAVKPSIEMNRGRRGVALDGKLKHQDPSLASSSLLAEMDLRESFGVIISYVAKVKLYLGALGGELTAELPFVLMHPKPEKEKLIREDSQAQVEMFRQDTVDGDAPPSGGRRLLKDMQKLSLQH